MAEECDWSEIDDTAGCNQDCTEWRRRERGQQIKD